MFSFKDKHFKQTDAVFVFRYCFHLSPEKSFLFMSGEKNAYFSLKPAARVFSQLLGGRVAAALMGSSRDLNCDLLKNRRPRLDA